MKQIYHILSLLVFLSLSFSCCNIGDEDEYEVTPTRTLLVYMLTSTNLDGAMQTNIADMKSVATRKNLNNSNLIVFYSTASSGTASGRLFRIKEDKKGQIIEEEIRTYSEISAISPDFMRSLIQDVIRDYPAKSYGMIFSSHGTSWMPSDYKDLRSFGEENGQHMEVYDLAKALRGFHFDFLLFDACAMGSVECLYELKDVADYIVSSAAEIWSPGFPYDIVLPYFFTEKAQLDKVAEGFYDFYANFSSPQGCVSVVKTNELDELASIVKDIISSAGGFPAVYDLSLSGIQRLSLLPSARTSLYDLEDLLKKLATEEQMQQLLDCLQKLVEVKYTTETLAASGGRSYISVRTFSGLSIYPLQTNLPQHNAWYLENLAWAKAVYGGD